MFIRSILATAAIAFTSFAQANTLPLAQHIEAYAAQRSAVVSSQQSPKAAAETHHVASGRIVAQESKTVAQKLREYRIALPTVHVM